MFEYTIQVDYLGSVYATKAAVPYFLKKKSGSIIHFRHYLMYLTKAGIVLVSSTVAVCGFIGYSTYAPAKYLVCV